MLFWVDFARNVCMMTNHKLIIRLFFFGRGSISFHHPPLIGSPILGSQALPSPERTTRCHAGVKPSHQSPGGATGKPHPPFPSKVLPRSERADSVISVAWPSFRQVPPPVGSMGHAPLSAKPRHFRVVLWVRLLLGYCTSRTKRTESPSLMSS